MGAYEYIILVKINMYSFNTPYALLVYMEMTHEWTLDC